MPRPIFPSVFAIVTVVESDKNTRGESMKVADIPGANEQQEGACFLDNAHVPFPPRLPPYCWLSFLMLLGKARL
jgi:hypothetical protein